ncbi:LOW QUALITY PROTEIN: calcium-activated chloride channel regulator 1-like [Molossus nigricans]
MVLSLTVILFLVLHLLPGVKTSMVNLNNNGYDGIVIAINSSVPEDEKLIQNTKEMVTEASTYLFHATKGRIYIRNVSILIPVTWKSKSEYLMSKQESYDQADVIVANPYLKYGDDPYTLQYEQCGEKKIYIHFTPNFLLNNNLHIYGSQGRVFVHEWAHLQWGVFDEYDVEQPFYISSKNTIEVTEFTATGTHSTEAPTPQNKMGSHRSTWDIIRESYDFQNVAPMTGTNSPPHPTFSLLKAKNQVVCLVLDKSGSMASRAKTGPSRACVVQAPRLWLRRRQ